ncbi:PRTRC genetic system protein C [Chitinophaga terrae (ex Kim and Jung 2007)]|uniref:PRTRC system protein C n=1 Tax=Chitinophaga terrae (ex Kim and Jung 2007) TaxID=408074 RepID=UPI002785BDCF|nr:PRTRC system protein C [Chitinophaga terrae (ex Kim and Jung 2007)]MDQ0107484.1 PRTRC genetic system protein C [Chitinophaga terrae (ex Kim and Jung 2007)]
MDLVITEAQRMFRFKYNGETIELNDPNPEFSAVEVMQHYAMQWPVLTIAKAMGPTIEKDGALLYKFVPTIGTKG